MFKSIKNVRFNLSFRFRYMPLQKVHSGEILALALAAI